MPSSKFRVFQKYLFFTLGFAFKLLGRKLNALVHRLTYRRVEDPLNVVIIGGSYGGVQLAMGLADSLPTGYRVTMIEKNSHFNHLFNFPRYTVLQGNEYKAFVPFNGLVDAAPDGSLKITHGSVVSISPHNVVLDTGEEISFSFLVLATGTTQPRPATLQASDKSLQCAELRDMQKLVEGAQTVALIGGGAVGVQLAADVKAFYPDKDVTLVHSKSQLLPHFGKALHDHVLKRLEELGVTVLLSERPGLSLTAPEPTSLTFKDGTVKAFDLVIPCTGQRPNSSLLTEIAPNAISSTTGKILVHPTLQVRDAKTEVPPFPNIFALGDVQELGVQMGRAVVVQADIVKGNILSLIRGRKLSGYVPHPFENILRLTLGRGEYVMYLDDGEEEFLFTGTGSKDDLQYEFAWRFLKANRKRDCKP